MHLLDHLCTWLPKLSVENKITLEWFIPSCWLYRLRYKKSYVPFSKGHMPVGQLPMYILSLQILQFAMTLFVLQAKQGQKTVTCGCACMAK